MVMILLPKVTQRLSEIIGRGELQLLEKGEGEYCFGLVGKRFDDSPLKLRVEGKTAIFSSEDLLPEGFQRISAQLKLESNPPNLHDLIITTNQNRVPFGIKDADLPEIKTLRQTVGDFLVAEGARQNPPINFFA